MPHRVSRPEHDTILRPLETCQTTMNDKKYFLNIKLYNEMQPLRYSHLLLTAQCRNGRKYDWTDGMGWDGMRARNTERMDWTCLQSALDFLFAIYSPSDRRPSVYTSGAIPTPEPDFMSTSLPASSSTSSPLFVLFLSSPSLSYFR